MTPSSWRNAFVTGFPTKPIRFAVQPERLRSSLNKPFRVATNNRSLMSTPVRYAQPPESACMT